MNGSLNKVMLIGNLGMDPEIRHFEDGKSLGRLRVATSEVYTDRFGERRERTEWHTVVVRNRLAEICHKYLRKGSKIYVEGRIQYREYTDNSGQQRFVTEIVATNLTFLSPRATQPAQNTANQHYGQAPQSASPSPAAPAQSPTASQPPASNEPEDDLPF